MRLRRARTNPVGAGGCKHAAFAPFASTPVSLSSKQRATLRGLAHGAKVLLHIGKEGDTDSGVAAASEALRTRELLKIRVLETAPDVPRAIGEALAAAIDGAAFVAATGRTVVLYRAHPETPVIRLA